MEFGRVHGAIGGVPRSVCRDEHIEMPCRSVPISEGHRHTHWAYSYPQSLCLFTQRRRRRPVALPCRLGLAVLALPSWPCRLGPAVLALLCQSRRLGPAWRGWCATAVCAVAIASAFLGGAAAPAALSDRGQRQQRQAARRHRRLRSAFCCRPFVARGHVVPCRVAPEWVLLIPPRRSLGVVDVQAASEPGVAGPVLLAHLVLGGNRWAPTCASTPTSSAAALLACATATACGLHCRMCHVPLPPVPVLVSFDGANGIPGHSAPPLTSCCGMLHPFKITLGKGARE